MRRYLTATLTLGWAACFVSQAAYAPLAGGEGAAAWVSDMLNFANVGLAAAFIWLAATCFADGAVRTRAFDRALKACFCAAATISLAGVVAAHIWGNVTLVGVLFFQLAALLASYLVVSREESPARLMQAANDNMPLSARLMASSAARLAMMENFERRRVATGGEGR
jgi:hypothetical protein